jgi:hypothetical protein
MLHEIIEILKNTALVTCLVMTMLLLIEYVNVATQARSLGALKRSPTRQLLVATLLGMAPGCIGGFATVSLFTHGVVSFGALVAAMIATLGDEAFVMFAAFPLQALAVQGVLVAVALAAGFAVNLAVRQLPAPFAHNHLALHADDHHHHEESVRSRWTDNLKNLSFQRALLLAGLLFFIVATLSGVLEHAHAHGEACAHAAHGSNFIFSERWLNLLFAAVAAAMLVIILRVSDHFLEHHLWGHVIKKHFAKIFLWTLGALTAIAVLNSYLEAETWVRHNPASMYLAALLIGLIPSSGPHLVFVLMFAQGSIPFGVLLVNALMQDGHAGLPLLAESKRGFLLMKGIKMALAAGVAAGAMLLKL